MFYFLQGLIRDFIFNGQGLTQREGDAFGLVEIFCFVEILSKKQLNNETRIQL